MQYVLKQHQSEGSDFILNNGYLGALLWHQMGLGKTLNSLHSTRILLSRLRASGVRTPKALVIMPKSALSTWQTECHKFTPDVYRDLVMLPHSQLHKALQLSMYYDFRVIIMDESHSIKNPNTNRVRDLSNLFRSIYNSQGGFQGGKVILLSGTPMLNGAQEWYTTWAMLASPNLMEASDRLLDTVRYDKWKMSFAKRKEKNWTSRGRPKSGASYEGVENGDMLTKLLSPIVHFRRTKDCLDLPEKEEVFIDLNLPDDKLLKDANIDEPEAYMALLEKLARAKTPYMMDWIADFLKYSDEQLVVFSNYKFPLHEIMDRFKNKAVMITGEQNSNERKENLQNFQNGNKRIIALTYRAGSEALNLQNASKTLYHGYPWTDGMVKQAMARTYRQGQNKHTMHYFLTSGFNDQRILSLVRAKEEATTEVEDSLLQASIGMTAQSTLDTFI